MKQRSFKDSPLYKMGHKGELIIKQILQEKGYFIIPSYDYSGKNNDKSPKMYGIQDDYIIPDLDICKSRTRFWVEVKTKSGATYTYITKRYEHGLPIKHYIHYLAVQKETGNLVLLYILEENTRLVLKAQLDSLTTRFYHGNKMSFGGMVFFPRDEFNIIGTFIGESLQTDEDMERILSYITEHKNTPSPRLSDKCNNKFNLQLSVADICFLKERIN